MLKSHVYRGCHHPETHYMSFVIKLEFALNGFRIKCCPFSSWMHKWAIICAYSPIINHSKYLICAPHSPWPCIQYCFSKLQAKTLGIPLRKSVSMQFPNPERIEAVPWEASEPEAEGPSYDQDCVQRRGPFLTCSALYNNSTTGSFLQTPVCGTARNCMHALETETGRMNWHELLMWESEGEGN